MGGHRGTQTDRQTNTQTARQTHRHVTGKLDQRQRNTDTQQLLQLKQMNYSSCRTRSSMRENISPTVNNVRCTREVTLFTGSLPATQSQNSWLRLVTDVLNPSTTTRCNRNSFDETVAWKTVESGKSSLCFWHNLQHTATSVNNNLQCSTDLTVHIRHFTFHMKLTQFGRQ